MASSNLVKMLPSAIVLYSKEITFFYRNKDLKLVLHKQKQLSENAGYTQTPFLDTIFKLKICLLKQFLLSHKISENTFLRFYLGTNYHQI